jgi:hypothetical protein
MREKLVAHRVIGHWSSTGTRQSKDKEQRTKDKGQRTKDKGQRTKDKGQRTKDKLDAVEGKDSPMMVLSNEMSL